MRYFTEKNVGCDAIAIPASAMCNEFSHSEARFGTFIFQAVFTLGFTTQIVKPHCENALTRKLRSHDNKLCGIKVSRESSCSARIGQEVQELFRFVSTWISVIHRTFF